MVTTVLNKAITFFAKAGFLPLRETSESLIVETRNKRVSPLKSFGVAALTLVLTMALGLPALSQAVPGTDAITPATPVQVAVQAVSAAPPAIPAVRMIEDFRSSDVKFDVNELVDILRDRRHEGWVLAAYPDPRTGQPRTR